MTPARSAMAALAAPELEELRRGAIRRRYRRREVIVRAGERGLGLHLIESGTVAVKVVTRGGEVGLLAVYGPGETFGELSLLGGDDRRVADVAAIEEVVTLLLRREMVEEVRPRVPAVDRYLVDVLADRLRRQSEQLVRAMFAPAEQRVLDSLAALACMYGSDRDEVTIPLTQDEIASLAATSRATVNQVLGSLVELGVVRRARGRVVLRDASAPARLAADREW